MICQILNRAKIILIILTLQSFYSCDNFKNSTKHLSVETVNTFSFLKKIEDDNKYTYDIKNESISEQEINDIKTKTETKTDIGLTYLIHKDSLNQTVFTLKYDKFKLHTKALEYEQDIDAETASNSTDPTQKVIGAFQNAAIKIHTTDSGKVIKVVGNQELEENMRKIANGDPDALAMINNSVKEMISTENIISNFEKSFNPLQKKTLKEGDQWIDSSTISAEIPIQMKNTYTVKSIEDNEIIIKSNAPFELIDQPTVYGKTNVVINLSGAQTGEIRIEISTGMLISSVSNFNAKGGIKILGQEIPLKMKTTSSVVRIQK